MDAQAHRSAVEQEQAVALDRAPEEALEVLLEENPQRQRELMDARAEVVKSTDFENRVRKMGEDVPDAPDAQLLLPEVQLRQQGLPGTVRHYLATPELDRPEFLVATAGQLLHQGEADTSALADLIKADTADVTDARSEAAGTRDVLVDLMDALHQARTRSSPASAPTAASSPGCRPSSTGTTTA
ncbi:hypothetical protein Acsp02_95820 [Actinoplanes sp. NBRC 103695]|nr:hypothetical protein Acsp02_95820 [Actinoplanes sp. NBRC 103695]